MKILRRNLTILRAKMFKKVVIGGTFDVIHEGHKKILEAGFQISDAVIIGLTSDEFANRFRAVETSAYEERKKKLEELLRGFGKSYEIIKIDDSYGIATIDPAIDCIVVSEETLLRAQEINAVRFKKSMGKLSIMVIPLVLAKDGKPISGERISGKEIDSEGKLLK
ncbi:MAG: pantetheine-phosphate adenylyltransferase [Candidatus Altiarchaeota archaeon]|nr:pantetheine-phosphate adenylyltransferase [Candidatus Altiarchaeota archaeon]